MRISRKGVLRALGLVALALLVQVQSAEFVVEASRDSAACVQACNAIKSACGDACAADCDALFGEGSPEYSACNSACNQTCAADQKECKAKCNVNKNPPSPTEP